MPWKGTSILNIYVNNKRNDVGTTHENTLCGFMMSDIVYFSRKHIMHSYQQTYRRQFNQTILGGYYVDSTSSDRNAFWL